MCDDHVLDLCSLSANKHSRDTARNLQSARQTIFQQQHEINQSCLCLGPNGAGVQLYPSRTLNLDMALQFIKSNESCRRRSWKVAFLIQVGKTLSLRGPAREDTIRSEIQSTADPMLLRRLWSGRDDKLVGGSRSSCLKNRFALVRAEKKVCGDSRV